MLHPKTNQKPFGRLWKFGYWSLLGVYFFFLWGVPDSTSYAFTYLFSQVCLTMSTSSFGFEHLEKVAKPCSSCWYREVACRDFRSVLEWRQVAVVLKCKMKKSGNCRICLRDWLRNLCRFRDKVSSLLSRKKEGMSHAVNSVDSVERRRLLQRASWS